MAAVQPLLVIVGPTASGKSTLGLELATRLGGEIISVDSVQIYRHFDVGSGKPNAAELAAVPHHGIDLVEPDVALDASQFGSLAAQWVSEVQGRGRLPIVCGGTFLWVRALVYGLVPAPAKDDAIRAQHQKIVESEGRAALHARLLALDPASHARLNPNDFVRVSRALEVFELTGKPLSALQAEHGFSSPRYHPLYLGIEHGAEALTTRIRARVETMLQRGWVDEVGALCARGYRDARAMNSVGYRQVLAALDAETFPPHSALVDEVTRATRIFSRRQRTWLRDQHVTWLTPEQAAAGTLPDSIRAALGV